MDDDECSRSTPLYLWPRRMGRPSCQQYISRFESVRAYRAVQRSPSSLTSGQHLSPPIPTDEGEAVGIAHKFTARDILFVTDHGFCPLVTKTKKLRDKRGVNGESSSNHRQLGKAKAGISHLSVDPSTFPGKVVWLMNEGWTRPRGHPRIVLPFPEGERQFLLGPYYPKAEKDIQSLGHGHFIQNTFAAMYLWSQPLEDVRSTFLDPMVSIAALNNMTGATGVREHFATYVSSRCLPWQNDVAYALNARVGTLHAGGRCSPTKVKKVDVPPPVNGTEEYFALPSFYRNYRFALVLENKAESGYVTEKIINADLGGAVPIYYGTKDVESIQVFSKHSFIYYNVSNPAPALRLLEYLEYLTVQRMTK